MRDVGRSENWKHIFGYEGHYMISDLGRVMSIKGEPKILAHLKNPRGYRIATLSKNNETKIFIVHRLVMMAFKPIAGAENLTVNHINAIRDDNRLENLEWCTQSENLKHAYSIGTKRPSRERAVIRLDDGKVFRNKVVEKLFCNKAEINKQSPFGAAA